MQYPELPSIIAANQASTQSEIDRALRQLEAAQQLYPSLILAAVNSGDLARQIDLATQEALVDPTSSPTGQLSAAAGAYFLNENQIGGSREADVLAYTNRLGEQTIPGWEPQTQKVKLGPGIGFVKAPRVYGELINLGLAATNLTANYTAPFGTAETTLGITKFVDAKIDPGASFFPENGVFLTQGATEGVSLFMEAIAQLKPDSRVVFLGLSYYTGPFSALRKGLLVDRIVANPIQPSRETKFFPSPDELRESLATDTSALVITIPNNPNGEDYSDSDITSIIQLAKEKDILILFDSLFETMYFDEERNSQSRFLKIAAELGALDNVVVVDGLSKSKNFPGERVGFLATTNQKVIEAISTEVLDRRCNPRLPLGPLVQFEGLARQVKSLQARSPSTPLDKVLEKAMSNGSFPFDRDSFAKMYSDWLLWDQQVLQYYQTNLEIVRAMLESSVSAWSPDSAAFNTFVQLGNLEPGTNSMDFLAKLMFTLATYTQIGPCFGISQKVWDEELGVWPRITYASSREDLIEGLVRLITFSRFYAETDFGNPNTFPALDIRYDDQI